MFLGHFLFLIFINDIPYASDLGTWLFADDTALVASANSITALESKMNYEVQKVQAWLLANKFSVHYVKKSQYMLVNTNPRIRVEDDLFELEMGGNKIERTKSYKYLGLTVDEKFSWSEHINELCSKLSQVAGVLFKIRKLLTNQALMLVYHGLVGSKLRYGLVCWATANKFLLNKVNVAHNTIITYLTFSKRCSRIWPLYCQLKVLPLDILIQIEYGKTMYKFNKGLLPPVFDTYFNTTHQHETRFRSNNNLAVLRISSANDKSRLRYIGPKIWLDIEPTIREASSLKVFVKQYRNHLIGHFTE